MAGEEKEGALEEAPKPKTSAEPEPPAAPPPPPPAEDWANRFKYLLAEFENFRRRTDREREGLRQAFRADIIRTLLPIHEGFQRARQATDRLPASDPVRRGIELLNQDWETFLRHERVTPVAAPGAAFHADDHEAVGEAPASKEHPDGTVVEVVQQGYRSSAGLLRPAKVIVARAPPPTEASATAADATEPEK